LLQCAGESVEVDAKASLDTCEEAPEPQEQLPQPKPRKKKKTAKRMGKCSQMACMHRSLNTSA